MTPIVELIVLMFATVSGAVFLGLLWRATFRPKPAKRLLTLVIEERDSRRTVPPAR